MVLRLKWMECPEDDNGYLLYVVAHLEYKFKDNISMLSGLSVFYMIFFIRINTLEIFSKQSQLRLANY